MVVAQHGINNTIYSSTQCDQQQSNAWTGELSFGGRSLHSITPGLLNPYEETLEALCNALESFDDDNLYPCYGFGDGTWSSRQRVCAVINNTYHTPHVSQTPHVSLTPCLLNTICLPSSTHPHSYTQPQPAPRISVCFLFMTTHSPVRGHKGYLPGTGILPHMCDLRAPPALHPSYVR